MEDSLEFDKFGRVFPRPIHYGFQGKLQPGATAPKVFSNVRFCVMCGQRLSMYNNGKDGLCFTHKT